MSGLAKVQKIAQTTVSEVPLLGGFLVYTSYPALKADSQVKAPKPPLSLVPEPSDTQMTVGHIPDFDPIIDPILDEILQELENDFSAEMMQDHSPDEIAETFENPVLMEADSKPGLTRHQSDVVTKNLARNEAMVEETPYQNSAARSVPTVGPTALRAIEEVNSIVEESPVQFDPGDLEEFLRPDGSTPSPKLRRVKALPRATQLASKKFEDAPVRQSFIQRLVGSLFVPSKGTGTQSISRIQRFSPGDTERNFFFRALDDRRLYKLGDSFYRDFKAGKRSFGFGHVNSGDAQKRSILGVASFIKYFDDLKILVVTDKMEGTFFGPFKSQGRPLTAPSLERVDLKSEITDAYGVHYLELNRLVEEHKDRSGKKVPAMIKSILMDYDLVLVDLPPEKDRKDHYNVYLPFLQSLDHVTLSISLRQSRFSEIQEMKDYFASYKIPIKGTVIDRRLEGVNP